MPGRLGETPFLDLLCNSLAADETCAAIAEALDGALDKSTRAIPDVLIYARLALSRPEPLAPAIGRLAELAGGLAPVSDSLLDLLAWQYHVDGYEAAAGYQARRELVDSSILLHRRKGTPWAVVNALKTAFQAPVDLAEWPQYGGKPYFFRVGIDISGIEWTEKSLPDAFRLIFEYKNVRSWLEWLTTRWKKQATRVIGAIAKGDTSLKSCLFFPPKAAPACAIFTGGAIAAFVQTRYTVLQMPPITVSGAKYQGQALTSHTSSRIEPWWPETRLGLGHYTGAAQGGMTKSAIRLWQPAPRERHFTGAASSAYTHIFIRRTHAG